MRFLGRGNRRIMSCKACASRDYSCPMCKRGITHTIMTKRMRGKVLVYKAKLKVSLTTGGMGKVHTYIYDRPFATGVSETRGSYGMLTFKTHIMNKRLTGVVMSA